MHWYWKVLVVVMIVVAALLLIAASITFAAEPPGKFETSLVMKFKYWKIGGKELSNPVPDTPDAVKEGGEHFQHHCQICHGLDGHNTGVPFASKSSPPVPDLASSSIQHYTDGQLKWIVQNGVRFSGMPAWQGILEEDEMWRVVLYLRHLPEKGSLGVPPVYRESEEQHEHVQQQAPASGQQPHEHNHPHR